MQKSKKLAKPEPKKFGRAAAQPPDRKKLALAVGGGAAAVVLLLGLFIFWDRRPTGKIAPLDPAAAWKAERQALEKMQQQELDDARKRNAPQTEIDKINAAYKARFDTMPNPKD